MNYLVNSTEPQDVSVTTRANLSNGQSAIVTTTLIPENNKSETIAVDSLLTARGYYSTLTVNTGLEALNLSPETMYTMTISNQSDETIYKGKILSTEQATEQHSVYVNEFTQTATSDPSNDFIIFE